MISTFGTSCYTIKDFFLFYKYEKIKKIETEL